MLCRSRQGNLSLTLFTSESFVRAVGLGPCKQPFELEKESQIGAEGILGLDRRDFPSENCCLSCAPNHIAFKIRELIPTVRNLSQNLRPMVNELSFSASNRPSADA